MQTVTGSQVTTASYGYDASGSTTTYAGTTVSYDESGRLKQVGTGTTAEKSIYTADGQLLLRYGGADGASLFLGDTILRSKAGVTTGVRSYVVAGIGFAERVSGAGGGLWWSSPDMVGTVGMEVNTAGAGTVTRRWTDPFGQARGVGANMLKDGSKTVEGALQASNQAGLMSMAGFGAGLAVPAVANIAVQALEKAAATAATKAAAATESAAISAADASATSATDAMVSGTNTGGMVNSRDSFRVGDERQPKRSP
ncbi:hypothetical protein [Microbacterium sp. NPDC056052]|uniref:hypothetical protein n=1 Tax=Microbacterium sp. NPDC056052 TaxID=3345695 RepID=UPI0035D750C0